VLGASGFLACKSEQITAMYSCLKLAYLFKNATSYKPLLEKILVMTTFSPFFSLKLVPPTLSQSFKQIA
jgi:hypothetical protein